MERRREISVRAAQAAPDRRSGGRRRAKTRAARPRRLRSSARERAGYLWFSVPSAFLSIRAYGRTDLGGQAARHSALIERMAPETAIIHVFGRIFAERVAQLGNHFF